MATERPGTIPGSFMLDSTPRLPARGGLTKIRRFNGTTRRTSDWDGLRKDDQLWFEGGDCLVHFCNHGASQRGASLNLPFEAVANLKCAYIMDKCLRTDETLRKIGSNNRKVDEYHESLLRKDSVIDSPLYELYIPSPSDATREQAFSYHITTRNLLAYAVGRPLVGEKLSAALIGLWKRLLDWELPSAFSNFTTYLEKQGYLNFAENAEHALACLKFAEYAGFRDMWIDAFVHCTGMLQRLDLSPEFSGLSNITAALITRASLEMDLRIARVTRAVGSFLDEELGPECFGLSKPARDHLDSFRSFLHAFYVDTLGYFPPGKTSPWDKRPWAGMHQDFQHLYDYLVDTESSCDWTSNRGLTGGICVTQNVQAFDQRHGYPPLPHPLPLLPEITSSPRHSRGSQVNLLNLKSGRTTTTDSSPTASQALVNATNRTRVEVVMNPLVKEYRRLERQKLEEKLDTAEARKVRWILIYTILQMLSSIMEATAEVRDTETPSYPLCALTTGCPPWAWAGNEDIVEQAQDAPASPASPVDSGLMRHLGDDSDGRSARISIHPDCEADNAEDFFAANCLVRQGSDIGLIVTPTPLKLLRSASIRSSITSVQSLHRSVVGTLSRHNAIRQSNRPRQRGNMSAFCEDAEDSHDSSENEEEFASRKPSYQSETSLDTIVRDPLLEFDFDLAAMSCEFIPEQNQFVDAPEEDSDDVTASPCESNFSATSGNISGSSSSSVLAETDQSSLEGDCFHTYNPAAISSSSVDSQSSKLLSYRPGKPNFSLKDCYTSVNVGCYIPSGMVPPRISSFDNEKTIGTGFVRVPTRSNTDRSLQTDESEEEFIRVWPKMRAPRRQSNVNVSREDVS